MPLLMPLLNSSPMLSGCSTEMSSMSKPGELRPSAEPLDISCTLLARDAELAVGLEDSGMASRGGGIATGGNLKKGATKWKGPGCRRPDTYALRTHTRAHTRQSLIDAQHICWQWAPPVAVHNQTDQGGRAHSAPPTYEPRRDNCTKIHISICSSLQNVCCACDSMHQQTA
jgi:hypothetical protein